MKRQTAKRMSHRFIAPLERSNNKLWGSHIRVPVRIAKILASGRSRRITCRLNGSEPFQRALLPFGSGQFVISVNKRLCSELRLEAGDEVHVSVQKDDSTYGLPMP